MQPSSAAALGGQQVHWTVMGQTAVTLDWAGPDSVVQYGTTTFYGQTVTARTPSPVPFSSAGPFWEAGITNLLENKLYHYSIGGGPDHTFRTPPPRGSTASFTIMVEGDIGDAVRYPNVAPVQSLIAASSPAFVLMVGDLTYGDDRGQEAVEGHFNDMMAWSQDAAYMPAWGNHEGDPGTDDLRNYKGRFELPNSQYASPGSPAVACCGEDWYWFDYGNVRFIAYPEPWVGALPAWSSTADSLMDAAQGDPAIRFVVTFGHRSAYSSGYHAGLGSLRVILDGLGASHSKYVLNVCGHSHNYERTYHQSGVVHVTVGTGGSSLETVGSCLWLTCQQPSWSAFRAMHHGPLRLRFKPAGIEGVFLCGPAGGGTNDVECAFGNVVDSFFVNEDRLDSPPVVVAPHSISDIAGTPISMVVTASDPNSESLASLTADLSDLPVGNGATFTVGAGNTSGTLTWSPTTADASSTPYKVTFTASNALSGSALCAVTVLADPPPTANLSMAPITGNAPLSVIADASGSVDSVGGIVSYRFDFGDGTVVGPQAEATATHSYAAGRWTATVLVSDGGGGSDTASASVYAANPGPGTNLVGNPSFETSTSGWNGTGATIQRVAGGFDGSFSVEATGPALGTAKFGLNDSPNRIASVPAAGTLYRFGAWVRSATGTGKAQIRIREYLGAVQQGSSMYSPDVPLSPTWKKASLDYVAVTTGSNIDFNVLYAPVGGSERFQVDNISAYQDYPISAVGDDAGRTPLFAAAMSPNPVRPDASFLFVTSRAGFVRVRLYDAAGRLVRRLLEEPMMPRGKHAARFDGHDAAGRPLPSGLYFYRVDAVEGSIQGRFIMLR